MSVQSGGPTGPEQDDRLAQETRGTVQAGHSTRAQEWREPEPPAEGEPEASTVVGVDHRGGTPPGMDAEDVAERSEIARYLGPAAFPAERGWLLAVARDHHAPDSVLRLLEQLPEGQTFDTVQQVAEGLGLGTESRRT